MCTEDYAAWAAELGWRVVTDSSARVDLVLSFVCSTAQPRIFRNGIGVLVGSEPIANVARTRISGP